MGAAKKLLVGIDEAGYGPNLGPLVVVAVSLEVPDETRSDELWDRMRPAVRRCTPEPRDAADADRLIVDDSKKVYAAPDGLRHLERAALAWMGASHEAPRALRELWATHCLSDGREVDESPWYAGRDATLPQSVSGESLDQARRQLAGCLGAAGFERPSIACQIVMPRYFNELVARRGTKSDALFQVNAELLRHVWFDSQARSVEVMLDKHGGRDFYWPLLQYHFSDTLVLAGREGARLSQYSMSFAGRRLSATFAPRADGEHLLVAWASMAAKYIREHWMRIFNDFWIGHIPGLRPTAGYPTDSHRFWKDIRRTVKQLGIARETLWRKR